MTTLPGWWVERLDLLLDALGGIELTAPERASLAILARSDPETVANLAGLFWRARGAGRAAANVGAELSALLRGMARRAVLRRRSLVRMHAAYADLAARWAQLHPEPVWDDRQGRWRPGTHATVRELLAERDAAADGVAEASSAVWWPVCRCGHTHTGPCPVEGCSCLEWHEPLEPGADR